MVETKPDLTPVTEADAGVEGALRALVAERRPGDAVVGEEFGADRAPDRRRWIVDPIDGTKNFVRGIPVWATLIALEDDGAVVVGVVSAPALGPAVVGGAGLGRVRRRRSRSASRSVGAARGRPAVLLAASTAGSAPGCAGRCSRWPAAAGGPAASATSGRTCWWPKAPSTSASSPRCRCGTWRPCR